MMCLSNCLRPRQSQDLSSASDSRTLSSASQTESSPTYTPTPDPSSYSTTSFTPTSTLFSTATEFSTSSPSFYTPSSTSSLSLDATASPLPSSSSGPPSSSTPPTSLSSGVVFSTFTSSFVTEINGSPTTIVTPIVTALRASASSRSSLRTSIIAGSVIAGTTLLILALATLFCLQRRKRWRQRYWALSRSKRLSSRPTLPGEDMDLPFPSPPFVPLDPTNPFSTDSLHRNSSAAGSVRTDDGGNGGAPVYDRLSFSRSQSPFTHPRAHVSLSVPLQPPSTSLTPPRLLRARASESGSIFQESVWPPPSAASQLMDPLTYASRSVDLARVVTDVMGPPESGPLLLLQPNPSRELREGQGLEQEQGALNPHEEDEGEDERQSPSPPRLKLQSSPPPSPPPSPPRTPQRPRPESGSGSDSSLRSPSTPWLSRPLTPKGSPLQRALPL